FGIGEEIKIYVEPRRVTLCGKAGPDPRSTGASIKPVRLHGNIIFRFLDLDQEIDPSQARAECDGCVVEITLPKVHSGVRAA
ncbi:MAG: Hsp20/alpha crystallin family protein, partial [Candidatus Acidiferrales bacterium]